MKLKNNIALDKNNDVNILDNQKNQIKNVPDKFNINFKIKNNEKELNNNLMMDDDYNYNLVEANNLKNELFIEPEENNNLNDLIFINNNIDINISEDKEEEKQEEELEQEEEEEINEKEENKKCSFEEHKDEKALLYCQECRINLCKKCENNHSKLFKNHHLYSLDKDKNEIFTGLCIHKKHSLELEFYCQTHNQLCCAACISKIKIKGKGQHKNCTVHYITKIRKNKKENMDKNIKKLEELSNKLEPSIKELKNIYEKINENKEKLKGEIQNIFTKIKNELNNREDKLLEEIDKKYNELFFNEKLIKESEKLPNLVKMLLEKGKINESDWNDKNLLPKLIYDCINIENSIQNINNIYEKIKNFNSNKECFIEFYPKNVEIEKGLINDIRKYGSLKIVKPKKPIIIKNNLFDNNVERDLNKINLKKGNKINDIKEQVSINKNIKKK